MEQLQIEARILANKQVNANDLTTLILEFAEKYHKYKTNNNLK